jgi:hypothetical protein
MLHFPASDIPTEGKAYVCRREEDGWIAVTTARSRVVDMFFARHDKTFEDSIVLGLGHDCYSSAL